MPEFEVLYVLTEVPFSGIVGSMTVPFELPVSFGLGIVSGGDGGGIGASYFLQ